MINKHKIVQVKQWLKGKICENGKWNFGKTIELAIEIQVCLWLIKIICKICVYCISLFIEIAPFLESFFNFIENLASTLSYKKKEFFFGFLQY